MRNTDSSDVRFRPADVGGRDGDCAGGATERATAPGRAQFSDSMAEYCGVISRQHSVGDLASAVCRSVQDAIAGARARLMICDAKEQTIYPAIESLATERLSFGIGLSGYVASTGRMVNVSWAARDPRYDSAVDDLGGSGDQYFLGVPVLDVDAAVIGVVTAVRPRSDAPFSADDARALQFIAFSAAPTLSVLLDMGDRLPAGDAKIALRGSELFLSEALEHHLKSGEQDGALLYSMPRWLRRSHLAIVGLSLCALAFMTVAKVRETVRGPALVRGGRLLRETASSTGVVASVMVSAGGQVRAGQALMRLREEADPNGIPYLVRAREDGVVDAVTVQQGQLVRTGDELIRTRAALSTSEVVCFFPFPPAAGLRPGMKLTLNLRGHEDSPETLTIDTVEEIHSSSDPAFDGEKDATATLGVIVPVVLVHSHILRGPSGTDGKNASDGSNLLGEGTVVIRSKPLIVGLVPGLSNLVEHWKGFFRAE